VSTLETTAGPSGLLLFGRYAYPPNRLGYCGADEHEALFEYLSIGRTDLGLAELARKFAGAYPYLRLIAGANDIRDPFDPRVVEAYWIGNKWLEQVEASDFYRSLKERFRPRMDVREFSWLTTTLEMGAKPHHNFHVFDIYRRAGLMRDGHATIALDRMDQCRISWGRVVEVKEAELVVNRSALELLGGKLVLGHPQPVRLLRRINGRGYIEDVWPGDTVSIHWDWVCERLSAEKLSRLAANTRRAISNTNTTM
jgi:hypothetical protein